MTSPSRQAEEMADIYTLEELDAAKELALHHALEAKNNDNLAVMRRYLAQAEIYNSALIIKRTFSD